MHIIKPEPAGVAERYTRLSQKQVPSRGCGSESHHRHSPSIAVQDDFSRSLSLEVSMIVVSIISEPGLCQIRLKSDYLGTTPCPARGGPLDPSLITVQPSLILVIRSEHVWFIRGRHCRCEERDGCRYLC